MIKHLIIATIATAAHSLRIMSLCLLSRRPQMEYEAISWTVPEKTEKATELDDHAKEVGFIMFPTGDGPTKVMQPANRRSIVMQPANRRSIFYRQRRRD
jgi:hypothetical protein